MPPVLVLREEKIGQRDLRLEAAEIRCVDGEGIAEAAIALGFGEIRSRRLDLGDQACLRCGGRGGRDLRLGGLLVSVLAFGLRRLDVHFLRRRRELLVRRLFLQPRTVIAEPPRRIADRRAVGLRRDIRVRCRLRKTIEREQAERQSQPEPRKRRLQDPTPIPQKQRQIATTIAIFNCSPRSFQQDDRRAGPWSGRRSCPSAGPGALDAARYLDNPSHTLLLLVGRPTQIEDA